MIIITWLTFVSFAFTHAKCLIQCLTHRRQCLFLTLQIHSINIFGQLKYIVKLFSERTTLIYTATGKTSKMLTLFWSVFLRKHARLNSLFCFFFFSHMLRYWFIFFRRCILRVFKLFHSRLCHLIIPAAQPSWQSW